MNVVPCSFTAGEEEATLGILMYPYLFSRWEVTYKRFLGKERTESRCLMTNLVKGETHWIDRPIVVEENYSGHRWTLPARWDEERALREGREFLRRHYVHAVRSWMVPVVKVIASSPVNLPYELYWKTVRQKQKLFLREGISQATDPVDRHCEIYDYLIARGVVK